MTPLSLADVRAYIETNIGPQFHAPKLEKIRKLKLNDIVKSKNPYLFRAKGSNSANDFISSVLDARLSSGEETTFGNFLEGVVRFVARQVYGAMKSGIKGLDMEFEDAGKRYFVSIKSGPNWGNSSQQNHLVALFNTAKKTFATSGGEKGIELIGIEGCCYGQENVPHRGTHMKLCGQSFWEFVSGGNASLYRDIIEPLGHQAKERNDEIELLRSQKLNEFTTAFVERFCDDGIINWDRLVQFNSGRSN